FAAYNQGLQWRPGGFLRIHRVSHLEADRSHHHPWIPFASLRKRVEQDVSGAIAGGGAIALSLAGAGRCGRAESGGAGFNAEGAKEIATRAHDGGDEFRARQRDARDRVVSRTRPADARTALWMRHSEFGAGEH